MSALTPKQVLRIMAAVRLLRSRGQLVAEFNQRLIAEVAVRWLELGAETNVTPAEWEVIDFSMEVMLAEPEKAVA